MDIHYTAEVRRHILQVWDDADSGRHAWPRQGTKFVTVEAEEDDGETIIVVSLVDKVDDMGYPNGNVLDFDILHKEDIEEIRAHTRMPKTK